MRPKYSYDLRYFKRIDEISAYWFGYLRARAYMFKNRHRIRCRVPIIDIGHLYQLSKDLGTIKPPQKIVSEFGQYGQLIIDNATLCVLLRKYGWNFIPSSELSPRHVIRGFLDGRGSISRNGKGIQSRYLKITFRHKNRDILKWIIGHLGHRNIYGNKISWTGCRAVQILRLLYLNQSRCLNRKLLLASDEIFKQV